MQRVDTSTALDRLVDNLADTAIEDTERFTRVKQGLDAYLGTGTETEALLRSRHLFATAMNFPPSWDAMRACVARTLVHDARQRSPRMANAYAQCTKYGDPLQDNKDAVTTMSAVYRRLESPERYAARMNASMAAVEAVCPTERMAYTIAIRMPAACLDALESASKELDDLAKKVMAGMDGVMLASAQMVAVPPLDEEETVRLPGVRAFMQATSYGTGMTYPEPGQTAFLRLIIQNSTTEQLERITRAYDTPEGAVSRQVKKELGDEMKAAMQQAMAARSS